MAEDLTGAGRALEAVERMTPEVRDLFSKLLGPTSKELGETAGDIFGVFRDQVGLGGLNDWSRSRRGRNACSPNGELTRAP